MARAWVQLARPIAACTSVTLAGIYGGRDRHVPLAASKKESGNGRLLSAYTSSVFRVALGVHAPLRCSALPASALNSAYSGMAEGTLFVSGEDRLGRPTLVARPSAHRAKTKEESLRAVEDCMVVVRESMEQLPKGQEQILVLYDLAGAGYGNLDFTFAKALLDGLVHEFPDCLEKVLVVNGHWSLTGAWNAIRRLLHPETRAKVTFYGAGNTDKLLEYFDADHPQLKALLA